VHGGPVEEGGQDVPDGAGEAPALAEALLRLLDGKRLRRPVFLDVIVFNYEHSPGNPSPRKVEDVNSGVLEAAVVEGSNTRYGEAVSNFRDLLLVQ
jgi:hypothetical protein